MSTYNEYLDNGIVLRCKRALAASSSTHGSCQVTSRRAVIIAQRCGSPCTWPLCFGGVMRGDPHNQSGSSIVFGSAPSAAIHVRVVFWQYSVHGAVTHNLGADRTSSSHLRPPNKIRSSSTYLPSWMYRWLIGPGMDCTDTLPRVYLDEVTIVAANCGLLYYLTQKGKPPHLSPAHRLLSRLAQAVRRRHPHPQDQDDRTQ